MSKAQAARTFSVSLSSVKRYVNKAQWGESLAPKKRPGSTPMLDEKARNLVAAELEDRPYLTLQERCDYIKLTILLPNHKHGRAKVAHYFGREWRPKGRVGESLEYSDPAAHTKIALHHGRSLWNTCTNKVL